MANSLKKVTTRAKAIRRKHPGMSWHSALKQAGKAVKKKAVKRKPAKRRAVKKRKPSKVNRNSIVKHSRKRRVSGVHKTPASLMREAKTLLGDKLGDLERRKYFAPLKSAKKKIAKDISKVKKQISKLVIK